MMSISGDTFNSIYVQAIDGDSNEAIGTWRRAQGSVPIDACSAVLHSSYEDSTDSIELKWVSPVDGNGKVVFG
uniref:Uncharacterized protein n=1 Tax=Phlebotomus papatasi TaxID=29031 RepID=A0A1B0DR80_PHLPP